VELTVLKICTKLEAQLWAFKMILNWACDVAQTGYKFIPQQEFYHSQLQIITKWFGMEQMTPKVVKVPLPGVQPDDVVPVTTFDFVSQLHSLLSDTKLNCPANLVINPFSQYIPPDGCLKEALSWSWYSKQHLGSNGIAHKLHLYDTHSIVH
jgi:hypothetical protein